MTDQDPEPEPEDPDLGEPIAQLAALVQEPQLGFLGRVRARIERRRLGSQITGLAWHGLAAVFIEFVNMFAAVVGYADSGTEDER